MQGKKRKAAWGIWVAIIGLLLIALTNVWVNGGKETFAKMTENITATKSEPVSQPETVKPETTTVQPKQAEADSAPSTSDSVKPQPAKQAEPTATQPAVAHPPAVKQAVGMELGKKITELPIPGEKVVYLTFDDGPGPYTKQMVDILNANKVQGTFFWIGQNFKPEWAPYAKQMLAQGHQIGAHSMRHEAMGKRSKEYQKHDLLMTAAHIEKLTGQKIIYFRPPYGSINASSVPVTKEVGQYMILWQADSRDWALAHNPQQILTNIKKEIKPGAIILMHERAQSLQVLPQVLAYLKQNGYTIHTLPTGK
ncbi:peptidoglycan/xylan/chitin deacetylase (PgdA/CDA1 family) [Aneurinibacillus soli]|uniref:Peptidoglycan-N-acetylglucosamine deacetylase n=1 Tax=Aneurinibacillus soli TaxID=1500254 RepID=A0A0U5BA25_9BACL|nr:polysaccharide deacetylase family protein [Aneurinibacillus soli]PYE61704.1 peptidoglycan/xylan/chitin deacetylase (PgdA/CDA1 family) [Aneurinibacillus soli]BAU28438.1 Peptidoglycan-N-acetylglucosamine deacetylase [Aneurinibacillus soli]